MAPSFFRPPSPAPAALPPALAARLQAGRDDLRRQRLLADYVADSARILDVAEAAFRRLVSWYRLRRALALSVDPELLPYAPAAPTGDFTAGTTASEFILHGLPGLSPVRVAFERRDKTWHRRGYGARGDCPYLVTVWRTRDTPAADEQCRPACCLATALAAAEEEEGKRRSLPE